MKPSFETFEMKKELESIFSCEVFIYHITLKAKDKKVYNGEFLNAVEKEPFLLAKENIERFTRIFSPWNPERNPKDKYWLHSSSSSEEFELYKEYKEVRQLEFSF